jgi:hypothetical protein
VEDSEEKIGEGRKKAEDARRRRLGSRPRSRRQCRRSCLIRGRSVPTERKREEERERKERTRRDSLPHSRIIRQRQALTRSTPLQRPVRNRHHTTVEPSIRGTRGPDASGFDDAVDAAEELEGEVVAVGVGGDDGVCTKGEGTGGWW